MAEPIAGNTLHTHFYNLTDTMEKAIEQVRGAIEGLVGSWILELSSPQLIERVELANYALTTLNNLPVVYEEDMQKTVEKVRNLLQLRLMQIDNMAHGWSIGSKEFDTPKQLEELALAVKILPFIKDRSVFTGLSPTFISPFAKKNRITLECTGNFLDTTNGKLIPTLVLKGKKFQPDRISGQLSFSIPYDFLFSTDNQPFKVIGFNVKIPYVAGKGWLGDKIAHTSHKGWISLLPDSPGRIVLEYVTAREQEERKIVSQLYTQNSKEEGEDQSIIDRAHILAPKSGWSLIKGSSELNIVDNQGKDNSWKLASEEPQKVTCQITTQKHPADKDSGLLTFEIRAVMMKTTTVFEQRRDELNLKWGDSIVIDPSKKEWKVIFSAFDGTRSEYTSDSDSPFLSIKSTDGVPTLSIKTPQTIKAGTPQPNPLLDLLLKAKL